MRNHKGTSRIRRTRNSVREEVPSKSDASEAVAMLVLCGEGHIDS